MSIKKILKNNLPIVNKVIQRVSTKTTHCQNTFYDYCYDCKFTKPKLCNQKFIFKNFKQVGEQKWHFYFYCLEEHKIIRSVEIEKKFVYIRNIKN